MAMVYITNGETTSKVPYAAYKSQYERLGFRLVDETGEVPAVKAEAVHNAAPVEEHVESAKVEEPVEEEEDEEEELEEEDTDAEFVEEILEKPLSQWSTDELKKFVIIKGIDTQGAKKTSEVRSIVKKYLDEQAKKEATNS